MVLQAINNLTQDKAPGPDGFPDFKKCWGFIKSGCIDVIHNCTLITLVPKKAHVKTIKDCRPICLLTSVYKILAKLLTAMLKLVMSKCMSPLQCAYKEKAGKSLMAVLLQMSWLILD